MKPSFIGIGAQKCATTWVYRNLEDHPQAVLSDPKELHFFSHCFDHGYQWYERHFAPRAGATAVGEYSTSYLYNADAAQRAWAYNPDFRLIVTLRDPVDRAYSNHLHEVRVGHVTASDLSFEASEACSPMYLHQSRYAEHLNKWRQHFAADRILVLFQEEIAADPATQVQRLYRFLGIDAEHRSSYLRERVNVSAVSRSEAASGALRTSAGLLRRLTGDRFVRDLKVHPWIRQLRDSNRQDLKTVIPPLQPSTEARLRDALADDMRELSALLGRNDLPWKSWKQLRT